MWNESQLPCAACCKAFAFRRSVGALCLLLALLTPAHVSSEDAPDAPEPRAPKTQERPAPARTSKSNQATTVAYRREARVVLGDGRTVRGFVVFRAPKQLAFEHTRSGVRYTKRFPIEEMESVRIRQWQSVFVRRNKQGEVFRFEPLEFEVRLKSGATLSRSGSFLPFLQQFGLVNDDGRVQLFAFWMDLRRADGTWFTGMQGSKRAEAHKDVVRMIEFVQPKPKEEEEGE